MAADPMNDPVYLRQLMLRGPHDPYRHMAEQRLQEMQQEAALGQQRDVHAENVRVREQGQQNTDRARTDTLRENERVHRDAAAQRALEGQRLTDYRNATLGQQAENAQSRKDLGLLNLAQSPVLMTGFSKQAPAIQKELLNRYFASLQGGGAAGAGPTGGAALAALGGTAAADAGTKAVRDFHVAQGNTTAPSPTTVAPSAAAAKAQAQPPPQPQGGGMAPGIDLVGDQAAPAAPELPPGQYMTPGGVPSIGGSPAIPADRLVQHGQVYGGPPGYDLNVNTGEYVPSGMVGTINGLPAGEAIAQGALRTGISPESPSGTAALRTKQATIAGTGNPSLNEELASAGTFAPSTLAEKPPATNRPFVGSPELFSPEAAPVPGAPAPQAPQAPQTVQSGRGEFRADYGLQPNTPGRPLDFPTTPPSYVNPNAVPRQNAPAPPPVQVAAQPPPPDSGVSPAPVAPPAPTTFSDITETVPPPAPESVPSGLTRPRSPNEVMVEGQTPDITEYVQNKYPQLSPEQRAALDEQRRRGLQ